MKFLIYLILFFIFIKKSSFGAVVIQISDIFCLSSICIIFPVILLNSSLLFHFAFAFQSSFLSLTVLSECLVLYAASRKAFVAKIVLFFSSAYFLNFTIFVLLLIYDVFPELLYFCFKHLFYFIYFSSDYNIKYTHF